MFRQHTLVLLIPVLHSRCLSSRCVLCSPTVGSAACFFLKTGKISESSAGLLHYFVWCSSGGSMLALNNFHVEMVLLEQSEFQREAIGVGFPSACLCREVMLLQL